MVGDHFLAVGHHKEKKNTHGKTLNTLNTEKNAELQKQQTICLFISVALDWLQANIGQRTQLSSSAAPSPTSCLLWSAPWCRLGGSGWKWGTGKREGICAYHTSLSSHWQESARGSVGESTCIQSAEERRSERLGGRIVGGGEGEKKLMPARHPLLGRFWSFSQREPIVPDTSSALLFVCACTCIIHTLYF